MRKLHAKKVYCPVRVLSDILNILKKITFIQFPLKKSGNRWAITGMGRLC
jgi:hypothetical protein